MRVQANQAFLAGDEVSFPQVHGCVQEIKGPDELNDSSVKEREGGNECWLSKQQCCHNLIQKSAMILSVWKRGGRGNLGLWSQFVVMGMSAKTLGKGYPRKKRRGRNLDPNVKHELEEERIQIQRNKSKWASIQIETSSSRHTGAHGVGTGGESQCWQYSGIQAGKLDCSLPICEIRTSGKKIFMFCLLRLKLKQ